jgi:hypothetical protein
VITNEAVLDMVRNTIEEEKGFGEQLKTAIFEPKMTRSRVKEALRADNVSPVDDYFHDDFPISSTLDAALVIEGTSTCV